MTNLPLRPNVCMLLFNAQGRIFLGERFDRPGVWQFPQGGVEGDGPLEESVSRELEEELGLLPSHIEIVQRLESTHEYQFLRPPDYAKGRFSGQSQTFWLVKFLGEDHDICLETAHPEFRSWKWCTSAEVFQCADPIRRRGYEKPLVEFINYISGNSGIDPV